MLHSCSDPACEESSILTAHQSGGAHSPRRKTVGLLINLLHHRYQGMICPGIVDGARRRDLNLIAFVGKSLKSPALFESQENVIYKLASEKNVDGLLILTGAIGNYVGISEVTAFCRSYSLPTVCVATPVQGIPSVWVDNESGMRELVAHFVGDHKYRRIAFIRGPSDNLEAEIRYKAFKDVLSENGVSLDPRLVVEGDFVWFSGREGIKTILDERGASFDAVIAANDEMLIGVHRELTSRGIRIPDDVALGGFDNIFEARIMTPEITTVSQPLYEQGMRALDTLADMLAGMSAPDLFTFPSRLIKRRSCGCSPVDRLANLERAPKSTNRSVIHQSERDRILARLVKDDELQCNNRKDYVEHKDSIASYLDAFIADLERGDGGFTRKISQLIESSQRHDVGLEFFRVLVTEIYRNVSSCCDGSSRAYDTYRQTVLMLQESISRYSQNKLVQAGDYNWAMINVTKTLSTTYDLKSLRDIIIRLLPTLDMTFCFIALYEPDSEPPLPTPKSSVFLDFHSDGESDYGKKTLFDTNQLLPTGAVSGNERYSLAVFPLVTENDHFGYIVFDYDIKRDPIIYETLQGHISASLKSATLLETVRKQSEDLFAQKNELSKSLERLRRVMGGFINAMSLVVETRDPYTAGHQVRVANLARAMATEMGLSKEQIEGIRVAGVLHDLGKLYIPSQILNKPGRLLAEELSLIKIHPQIGANILKSVDFPWPIDKIVLQHHERIDGSGYPAGLKGDEILIEAQIICIADVVEAMASHRPYRPAPGIDKALEEIEGNKGKLYNASFADCCIRLFREKGFKLDVSASTFQYPQTTA